MKFATGGFIKTTEDRVRMTVERVGQCICGQCLYSFNGQVAEHVFTAEQIRRHELCRIARLDSND